jgi:hypothetical protein
MGIRMGEHKQATLFRSAHNRAVRVEASEADLSEDPGALVLRDVAAQMGLDDAVAKHLVDRRSTAHVVHSLPSLIRTAVLLHAHGWVDQDDADLLRHDPVFRVGVADGRGASAADRPLASQPSISRTITMLAEAPNLAGLHRVAQDAAFNDIARTVGRRVEFTIDIDSYPEVAHGHQDGAVYNAHYHDVCLHPIIAVSDTGHFLDGQMRPGNAHTAQDARQLVAPLLPRARGLGKRVWVRFDAGYVAPGFMDWLDEERVRFVGRIKSNAVLQKLAEPWADRTREAWRATPSAVQREATIELRYQAGSWSRERRIVAVLVERIDGSGELFDHLFFLVTNAALCERGSAALLAHYRKRGRAENHIGELVNVIGPKASLHELAKNEVVLLLGLVAYNLVHHVRRKLEAHLGEGVSLRRVRDRFLKAAAKVVRHARRVIVRIGRQKVAAWQTLIAALVSPTPGIATEGAAAR